MLHKFSVRLSKYCLGIKIIFLKVFGFSLNNNSTCAFKKKKNLFLTLILTTSETHDKPNTSLPIISPPKHLTNSIMLIFQAAGSAISTNSPKAFASSICSIKSATALTGFKGGLRIKPTSYALWSLPTTTIKSVIYS